MLDSLDIKGAELIPADSRRAIKKFCVEFRERLGEPKSLFWTWVFNMNPESLYEEVEDLPLDFFKKVLGKVEF
jgi:hypothetical protein